MKRVWLILVGLAALLPAGVGAVEVQLEGLTMPFFDPEGRLSHKLLAKRGSADGELRRLQDVEVVYFSADEPGTIVQRLTAADAVWSEKADTLVGEGPVTVSTEENRISGTGFDFSLATARLNIHHDFHMANDEFLLTGDRANADLIVERAGDKVKLRDVRRCEATGNLHFVSLKPAAKLPFREAFTDLAIYDAIERTITLPHPTETVDARGRGQSKFTVLHLGPREPKPGRAVSPPTK